MMVTNWKRLDIGKKLGFRLDIEKKFLTVRVMRHWIRLPRKAVGAPETLQDQVGWDFEQPYPVEGVPAYRRGVTTR